MVSVVLIFNNAVREENMGEALMELGEGLRE
jgi:hypothetical protein